MGLILGNKNQLGFLSNYGFTYEKNDIIGAVGECWERFIELSSLYDMYVSVSYEKNVVSYYVEYECGGCVATHTECIPDDIDKTDEVEFTRWLDDVTTAYGKQYQ